MPDRIVRDCFACETSRMNQQRHELEARPRIAMRNFVRNIFRRRRATNSPHSPLCFSPSLLLPFSRPHLLLRAFPASLPPRRSRSLAQRSIWLIFSTLKLDVEPINFGIRRRKRKSLTPSNCRQARQYGKHRRCFRSAHFSRNESRMFKK